MKDVHKKLIVLGVIWLGVGGAAYHAFFNVLPAYGYLGGAQRPQFDRDYWREIAEEEQEFRKTPLPKRLEISIEDAEQSPRRDWITNHEGRIRGKNATLGRLYASIRGLRNYQVEEMPEKRYDIEILAPDGLTPETIAAALVKEADMETREIMGLLGGYYFKEGAPPTDAPAAPEPGRRGGGQRIDWKLGDMRWRLGAAQAPVQVDRAVRDKMPLSTEARMPRQMDGERLTKLVAAQYGVAVESRDIETTRVFIFEPDSVDSVAVGTWMRKAGSGE